MGTETLCSFTRTLAGKLFRCVRPLHGDPIYRVHARNQPSGYWVNQHYLRPGDRQ